MNYLHGEKTLRWHGKKVKKMDIMLPLNEKYCPDPH